MWEDACESLLDARRERDPVVEDERFSIEVRRAFRRRDPEVDTRLADTPGGVRGHRSVITDLDHEGRSNARAGERTDEPRGPREGGKQAESHALQQCELARARRRVDENRLVARRRERIDGRAEIAR